MGVSLQKLRGFAMRGKYFLLAITLAITATLGGLPLSWSAHAAIGTVSQYSIPTSGSTLNNITVGPDNNIWYTAYGPTINTRVGKLTTSGNYTEYPNRTIGSRYPQAISKGLDGNIWYSEQTTSGPSRIVKMTTAGVVLDQYSLPSGNVPVTMTLGSDGAVWFVQGASTYFGKITTTGSITQYSVGGTASTSVNDITTGPDGNMWFTIGTTGSSYNRIGKITSSGTITTYQIPTSNAFPEGIVTGSDGNLWFTESGTSKIGKITTAGVVTEYSIPTANAAQGITAGSDGALWFTESGSGKIGRVTVSGSFTEYSVPGASNRGIEHIVTGSDGAVWFSDWVNGKIGRVATELTHQIVTFTTAAPTNATIEGTTYTPVASATSGLPVAITVDSSASGVCSMDVSGVVSFQGAGTCILNANQAGNTDYNPAAQVQQSFTVLPVNADTSVALGCTPTAAVGDAVTCTITMTNNGPAASQNASLAALFSNSFSNASLTGGGTLSGQNITWTVPSLAPGDSTTLTFTATAMVAGKARFNAALLQTSPDPDDSNNIVASTIVIL